MSNTLPREINNGTVQEDLEPKRQSDKIPNNTPSTQNNDTHLVPLNTLPWLSRATVQQDLELATQIQESGCPNVVGCRIQVQSNWNFDLLDLLVTETQDREVLQYLRYGWPINYLKTEDPIPTFKNHRGATEFPDTIDEYIQRELGEGRLVGPVATPAFRHRTSFSPMTTRPKRESTRRRVICDLSWPPGQSINDGIPQNTYMYHTFRITYPTVDIICNRVRQLQPQKVLIYRRDLAHAFRQLILCPRDWPLMGTVWRGAYFYDKVAVMGGRSSPYICMRVTNMICRIMGNLDHYVLCYVDDFIGIDVEQKIWENYYMLNRLLRDTGVREAVDKAVQPAEVVECLGTGFDLQNKLLFVTSERVDELTALLQTWRGKTWYTRKQLESLIGKLQFVTNCVRPGRVFISRLINELKHSGRGQCWETTQEMQLDIRWWLRFLHQYDRTSFMWHSMEDTMFSDASGTGIGGYLPTEHQCLRGELSRDWIREQGYTIAHLEMLAILVCLKCWTPRFRGMNITTRCDNMAVVNLINKYRARDKHLQKMLRELMLLEALGDFRLEAKHVLGKDNEISDVLSRSHLTTENKARADTLILQHELVEIKLDKSWLNCDTDW